MRNPIMISFGRIPSEPPSLEGSQQELTDYPTLTIDIPAPLPPARNSKRFIPTLPLSVLLSVIIGGTQLTLGLVAWHYTVSATQPTARVFADDLQTELLDTVALRLQTHIDTAERLTGIQAANWRSDVYRNDQQGVVMDQLLDTLTMYNDLVATQTFTTRRGGLNGFFTRVNPVANSSIEYVKWETDSVNASLTETIVDPSKGTQLAVLSQQSGYNASNERWVTQVGPNPTPSSPAVWSTAYKWGGNLWITLSRAAFDSQSTFQGVACTDLDLAFISRVLSASILSGTLQQFVGPTATLYAFERDSMAVIGSSDVGQYRQLFVPSENRSLTFQELGSLDPRLRLLAAKINPENKLTDQFTFNLGTFSAKAMPVRSANPDVNLHWILLLLFPSSTIHDPISAATSRSIGTVVALVIVGIASSIVMSLAISKVLSRIANDMRLLAEFQFRQVIASRDSLKHGTSNISEVWKIQNAFFATTKLFGTAVRRQRSAGGWQGDLVAAIETTELDLAAQDTNGEVMRTLAVPGVGSGTHATVTSTTSGTVSTVVLSSQASSGVLLAGNHMGPLWEPMRRDGCG